MKQTVDTYHVNPNVEDICTGGRFRHYLVSASVFHFHLIDLQFDSLCVSSDSYMSCPSVGNKFIIVVQSNLGDISLRMGHCYSQSIHLVYFDELFWKLRFCGMSFAADICFICSRQQNVI